MHGLPRHHDGPIESWSELLGYLRAIASSNMPIEVSVRQPGSQRSFFVATGKLSCAPLKDRDGVRLGLGERLRSAGGWVVWLDRELFEGGQLHTFDDDDYFGLTIETPGGPLRIGDTNMY